MGKIYKEPEKEEMETTINVLYNENILSIIIGSSWDISLDDKSKIQKLILKADIFNYR